MRFSEAEWEGEGKPGPVPVMCLVLPSARCLYFEDGKCLLYHSYIELSGSCCCFSRSSDSFQYLYQFPFKTEQTIRNCF